VLALPDRPVRRLEHGHASSPRPPSRSGRATGCLWVPTFLASGVSTALSYPLAGTASRSLGRAEDSPRTAARGTGHPPSRRPGLSPPRWYE
jgi:hypothetical protein